MRAYPIRLLAALLLTLAGGVAAQQTRPTDADHIRRREPTPAIVEALTLRQKVAQMFAVGLYGPNITDEGARFLAEYQPGSVVVFAYNAGTAAAVTTLVNDWQQAITEAGGLPLLVSVDQEGGRINTFEEAPFTQFPVPALVTATGNHNLAYRVAAAGAAELRAVGVHMNLAPVADLETNPDNPVIFRRAYGGDPGIVSPTLAATVQGMQDSGVVATLKHFPGHGDTSEDSHIELPVLPYDLAAIEALELIPFRAGIAAGAEAVMVGHLWLPEIDPTPNLPASLSRRVVTDLLRESMGYNGIIMTDALDMDAIDTAYTVPLASVMAVQAGIDLLATGPHAGLGTIEASIDAVVAAVEDGQIDEASIDDSVTRILSAKYRYGVLDWSPLDPAAADERVLAAGGAALIDELFTAGVTLVYDSGLLPIQAETSVALIYPSHRPVAFNACAAGHPNTQQLAYSNYPTAAQIAEAVRLANTTERVIVFTQNAVNKPEQAALVNALPPEKTVVVAYWSPYDLTVFARLPAAYLATYSPHDAGLATACRVLYGEAPPRGRLPMNLTESVLAASGAGWPAR